MIHVGAYWRIAQLPRLIFIKLVFSNPYICISFQFHVRGQTFPWSPCAWWSFGLTIWWLRLIYSPSWLYDLQLLCLWTTWTWKHYSMNHFMLNHVVTTSEAMANFKYVWRVCILYLATSNLMVFSPSSFLVFKVWLLYLAMHAMIPIKFVLYGVWNTIII
jgi:hypothetical protein